MLSLPILIQGTVFKDRQFVLHFCMYVYIYIYMYIYTQSHTLYIHGEQTKNFSLPSLWRWYFVQRVISLNQSGGKVL